MINEKNVKMFCKEDISKIENYDKAVNDTTQVWHCHHRTEIWWNCSKKDLIDNDCYNHRKACELIFLTPAEHLRLHMNRRPVPAVTRKKMSDANLGKVLSDKTKLKMSKAFKGKSWKVIDGKRVWLPKE